ncbi:DNA cytosine methyltransferase [Dictyobacter formicarum]|uniref:DNA (cytosine-5-)-methyltransferase n=1 Tax=Dictyobacter formicarum TaxID=2778368 RepID=A0ABQ3VA17_9CHLR|nr:DNA cytosine methyltransferase [Dictyobacter formicarum]GHO82985.1 DNA cytosine methyltransferase [Dictyobacter formicarum]
MTQDITLTDMFCGAGGTSTGAVAAGIDVRLAINHWKRAIETHNCNHPNTAHVLTDLHKANPRRFPSTTGLAASPECTSHTLAKGRKRTGQQQLSLFDEGPTLEDEAEERSRCTMWTPLDWAEYHNYQFVILENVVDAHLWRPFDSWLQAWKSLGYDFELVYFNSMFAHPTPQSRDRMYFVAWKKGNRRPDLRICPLAYCGHCGKDVASVQSWKNVSKRRGKYKQQYVYRCPECAHEVTPYYYAAANAIDWTIPAPRIGDRVRPLREKTLQRIADGLQKFAGHSFSIPMTRVQDRFRDMIQEPFPTQTGTETQGLVVPYLINLNHTAARPVLVVEQPFHTQTAYDATGVVLPYIAELHGTSTARSATEPLATICVGGLHHGLVTPPFILDHLAEYRPREITRPMSTICAAGNHHSIIVPPAQSWLMTYYNNGQLSPVQQAAPTVTTLERHALVTSEEASSIAVEDCGFRMLFPKEIQAAMAFPTEYVITGNRREQVKQLGNAVTPPVMQLLVSRILQSLA